jgi:hypothetical protein
MNLWAIGFMGLAGLEECLKKDENVLVQKLDLVVII